MFISIWVSRLEITEFPNSVRQYSLTEMNHVNRLTSYVLHKLIHILYCVCILVLCVILLFFYPLHLYVFVLICQYYVVLLERTNKDIIYIYIYKSDGVIVVGWAVK